MHNYIYNIFNYLKEGMHMRACNIPQFLSYLTIQSLFMDHLLKRQLVEMPAISDTFSMAQPILQSLTQGWRMGWQKASYKMAGKYVPCQNYKQPNSIGRHHFIHMYYICIKAATSKVNLTCQLYSDLQLAICLTRVDSTI